jgi:hypothetical protein
MMQSVISYRSEVGSYQRARQRQSIAVWLQRLWFAACTCGSDRIDLGAAVSSAVFLERSLRLTETAGYSACGNLSNRNKKLYTGLRLKSFKFTYTIGFSISRWCLQVLNIQLLASLVFISASPRHGKCRKIWEICRMQLRIIPMACWGNYFCIPLYPSMYSLWMLPPGISYISVFLPRKLQDQLSFQNIFHNFLFWMLIFTQNPL